MLQQPGNWWTRIASFFDKLFELRERGLAWLMRGKGRDGRPRRPRRQLEIECLETRQMLSATPLATPYLLPLGEANLDIYAGAVRLQQSLNLDISNGTDNGKGITALDYNSATTNVRPIITLSVPTDPLLTVPTSIVATLTFNGTTQLPVVFTIPGGHSAGDTYTLALSTSSTLTSTGEDAWSASVVIFYSPFNHPTTSFSGSKAEVVRDSSPYGAGWGLDNVDQLVSVTGGVLWVAGSGDAEFFASAGGGAFTSPANDFGTLVQSGGVYTYTAIDNTVSQFNSSGQLTSRTDPDGTSWSFTYDGSGRVSTVSAPDGSVSSLSYGTNSQLSKVYEPGSRSLSFTESSSNLTQIVDVDGTSRNLTYDGSHHVTSDSWSPYSTSFTYGGIGLLTGANSAGLAGDTITPAALQGLGTTAAPASALGQALVVDGDGHSTSYTLDSASQLTREVQPGGLTQTWSRDAHEQVTVYTDAKGLATSNYYSYGSYNSTLHAGEGDLYETVFPDGSSNTFQHDGTYHNLTQFVDGDGNITSNSYSGSDLTSSITGYGTGAASTINQTWSGGLLLTMTDGDGNITSNSYNGSRQLTATVTSDPTPTIVDDESITYDSNGFQATQVVGVGGGTPETTTTTFDKKGELLTQTNPAGDSITNTYLTAGFLATTTDGNGVEESLTYDTAGRLATDIADANQGQPEPAGETHDGAGNLVVTGDANGNTTSAFYDSDDRVTKAFTFDSLGTQIGSMSYTWDNDSNVLTMTDGVGNVTSDSWDNAGRLLSEIVKDAGGTVVRSMAQTFDNNGNVLTSTDGDGNVTSNTWDAQGRLTVRIVKDSGGSTVSSLGQEYDGNSNVIRSTDGDGNVTSDTLDGLNRVLVETVKDSGGTMVSSRAATFDRNGNQTTSTDGDGNVTSDTFDADGRVLTEVVKDPGGTTLSSMAFTHDNNGNTLTSTDGDGNITSSTFNDDNLVSTQTVKDAGGTQVNSNAYTYDKDHNLLTSTDGVGNVTSNTWDGSNLVRTTVKDSGGSTVSSMGATFDKDQNVITSTDGDGNVTSNTWDGGNLIRVIVKDSGGTGSTISSMSATFDKVGNILTSTDGDNNVTSNTWDGNNLVQVVVKDNGGNTIGSVTQTFDNDQNLLTSTDGTGVITSNTYDGNELRTSVVKSGSTILSSMAQTFDNNQNVVTSTDGDGNVTSNTWDGYNLLSSIVKDNGGSTIGSMAATYDATGNVVTSTDGDGNVTSNTWDGGNLIRSIVKAGSTTISSVSQTFDKDQNVLTSTDGDGNVTSNTWDGGNLIRAIVKDNGGSTVSSLSQTFDQNQNLLLSTNGGTVTSNTWDGNNLVRSIVKDNGGSMVGSMSQTFDQDQNVLTSTDGLGNVTSNTWAGNLLKSVLVKNAGGTTIRSLGYAYDQEQNVLTSTDTDGNVTSNTWQGSNLTASTVTDSGSSVVSSMAQSFDGDGNVLKSTDGDGNVTTNTWDGNELRSTVITNGGSTIKSVSYDYDTDGNLLRLTDGDGNVTSNTWSGNEVVSTVVHDHSGTLVSSESFGYDQARNQTSHVDPNGRTISSTFDDNRLVSQTWYNSGGTATASAAWSYDNDGNLLTASNAYGIYSMTYDGDRMMTQVTPTGLTLNYTYDNNENVATIIDSAGGTTSMSWNASGQLITKTYHDASTNLRDDFTYDTSGNMLTATRYSDLSGTTKVGFTQYAYDGNRVTDIQHKDGGTTVLASFSYQYDSAGRLTREVNNGTTTNYGYDASGQLTSAGATNYAYDGNGVAHNTGDTTGVDNQLASDGTWNYSYDSGGNMTGKVNSGTGITWTYGYDNLNHLISATEVDSMSNVLVSTSYTYDVFGRRVQSSVSLNGGAATVTKFVYDGDTLYATLNSSNTIITRYIAGAQQDEWLANVTSGTVNWYLTDHLGSVRDIVTNAGGYIDQLDYDAYGNITHNATPANTGILGYAGYHYDAALGLYYVNARWYDPQTQQWMGNDPTGLTPDENRRRYVENNPLNFSDPSGLLPNHQLADVTWNAKDVKDYPVKLADGKLPGSIKVVTPAVYAKKLIPTDSGILLGYWGVDAKEVKIIQTLHYTVKWSIAWNRGGQAGIRIDTYRRESFTPGLPGFTDPAVESTTDPAKPNIVIDHSAANKSPYFTDSSVGRYEKLKNGDEVSWMFDDPILNGVFRNSRGMFNATAAVGSLLGPYFGIKPGTYQVDGLSLTAYFNTYFTYHGQAFAVVPWQYHLSASVVKGEWTPEVDKITAGPATFKPGATFLQDSAVVESSYMGKLPKKWYGEK